MLTVLKFPYLHLKIAMSDSLGLNTQGELDGKFRHGSD
jgi:hypothetical protein